MLNYRRYALARVPEKYHEHVKPYVEGPSVLLMGNELDGILSRLLSSPTPRRSDG